MKTSFKNAMKCFQKSLPGVSYLAHKGYFLVVFVWGGWHRGLRPGDFCPVVYVWKGGGLCPDTDSNIRKGPLIW